MSTIQSNGSNHFARNIFSTLSFHFTIALFHVLHGIVNDLQVFSLSDQSHPIFATLTVQHSSSLNVQRSVIIPHVNGHNHAQEKINCCVVKFVFDVSQLSALSVFLPIITHPKTSTPSVVMVRVGMRRGLGN